jgi:transglycosylase-like protein with SLT domain
MQFIPATGRRYGLLTHSDLHDPLRSIDVAARYVRDLNMMFQGRIDLVLAGYNAGENAVINSGYRVPPYRETQSYVTRGVSVFRRIAQANILSLERDQVQTPQVKQTVSSSNRSALRYLPPRERRRPALFTFRNKPASKTHFPDTHYGHDKSLSTPQRSATRWTTGYIFRP